MHFSTFLVAATATLTHAQSTFSPLRPPAIPLAVKSPYMSTWQQAGSDGGNGGYLAGQWPTFWQGQITGWCGYIRVDSVTYVWLGAPANSPRSVNQTAFRYTSTQSIFTLAAGPVQLEVTFLSGVTPNDLLRSSLPYTYMNVDVQSTDGSQHDVQLYTDISAEWVSGDHGATAQWTYGQISGNSSSPSQNSSSPSQPAPASSAASTSQAPAVYGTVYGTQTAFDAPASVAHTNMPIAPAPYYAAPHYQGRKRAPVDAQPQPTSSPANGSTAAGGIAYHKVYRQQQLEFSEENQQANWGNWYYATANTTKLTFQSGADASVRGNFMQSGVLNNTQDTNYRAINSAFPVFGYAVNLGLVGSSTQSTLFQLSLHQQNCIQFQGTSNNTERLPCMWTNYFSNETSAVQFFYDDYQTGLSMANSFDSQVSSDSNSAGGSDLSSLTALAARQAFGALEYTNSPTNPLIFMKEISSDGNVNTVDVIMPFHPIAIYTNPTILKWLLDPLFINQEAGHWPRMYSLHDIGSGFPNATGHSDGNDEDQPLEECGNMLIMTLAYAQRANDNAYLSQHYQILNQWTQYLVEEALVPARQISTDDFAGSAPNQTNLAIKGIIGIEAMAQIANRTGNVADGQNYTRIAHEYVTQWMDLGTNSDANPPHTTFSYNDETSYSLLYNLFGDRELGLQLVPQSVYDMQSTFYATRFNTYGVPLDTRHTYTKGDWEIWCASVANATTKSMFISTIANWLNVTTTRYAFTDWYDTVAGDYPAGPFIARPVVGAMYAPLALVGAPTSGIVNPS